MEGPSLSFKLESSESRTHKHKVYSEVYIYRKDAGLLKLDKASIESEIETRPLYAKGSSKIVKIVARPGDYILYFWLVRNFRREVKGYISVFSHRGELLYRAKYVNGILRYSMGNKLYSWLVRVLVDQVKLPVKKFEEGV